jgi:hypothetical protein
MHIHSGWCRAGGEWWCTGSVQLGRRVCEIAKHTLNPSSSTTVALLGSMGSVRSNPAELYYTCRTQQYSTCKTSHVSMQVLYCSAGFCRCCTFLLGSAGVVLPTQQTNRTKAPTRRAVRRLKNPAERCYRSPGRAVATSGHRCRFAARAHQGARY